MGKSLADLTAEIREINVSKGWRPVEGGPGDNTFGDYLALLHSEVSEALEAYRDHGVEDATTYCGAGENPKPEGVGSELADVLIRLLDMSDVFGLTPFDTDCELADVAPVRQPSQATTFGDHIAWLHRCIAIVVPDVRSDNHVVLAFVLRALVTVSERYGIDLTAEVDRKIAYNRTRSFRHGGRAL